MRYFLVTYVKRPNGKLDEVTSVSRRLRKKDLQMVNVILDFEKMQVINSSLQGQVIPKNWDSIHNFYYQHYKNTFDRLHEENGRRVIIDDTSESNNSAEMGAESDPSTAV